MYGSDPTLEELKEIVKNFKFELYPLDKTKYVDSCEMNDYCNWEDDDKLLIWFDMPGFGPDDFQFGVTGDTMMLKGEGIEFPVDGDEVIRRYAGMFALYDLDSSKKAMKNGVLKMEISKVKK